MTNPIHESAKRMAAEWRDIETAPLSTPIIVWEPRDKGGVAGEAQWFDSYKGWWWAGSDPTDAYDGQCYPTKWMPLPFGPQF